MSWEVEYTDEFGDWWNSLTEAEQEALDASVRLLEQRGPALGFPHSSGITGSTTYVDKGYNAMGMAVAMPPNFPDLTSRT